MEEKILKFEPNKSTYLSVSKNFFDKGETEKGVNFLYEAYEKTGDAEILSRIATELSKAEMYEASNEYWIKYLPHASKNKKVKAYENLSINNFQIGNFDLSEYYFSERVKIEKISEDTLISYEMTEELLKRFDKNDDFYVVYPYSKKTASKMVEKATMLASIGKTCKAEEILSDIPKEFLSEDDFCLYASLALINGDDEKAIKLYKETIARNGESACAYAGLSRLLTKDTLKSEYYYKKALELYDGDVKDATLLVGCAIVHGDHKNANRLLEKAREVRFDERLENCYAISFLNLGNYQKARELFIRLKRLFPYVYVYDFYLDFTKKLMDGEEKAVNALPFEYVYGLPSKIFGKYGEKIESSYAELVKSYKKTKRLTEDYLQWVFIADREEHFFSVNALFSYYNGKKHQEFLMERLIDVRVSDELKRNVLLNLLNNGYRGRINYVAGGRFNTIQAKKILADGDKTCENLTSAYIQCLSECAIYAEDYCEKVCVAVDKLYKNRFILSDVNNISPKHLSLIIMYMSGVVGEKQVKSYCTLLDIDYNDAKQILEKIKGLKNDKNTRR